MVSSQERLLDPHPSDQSQLEFITALTDESQRIINRIRLGLDEFTSYAERNDLLPCEDTFHRAQQQLSLLESNQEELTKITQHGIEDELSPLLYRSALGIYRSNLLIRSSLVRLLSWASTAYGQSLSPYFFWLQTTGYEQNIFNYDRAGGYRQKELAVMYQKALGVTDNADALLTSSCMSAIALLERYILDQEGDLPLRLLLPRKIYFETSFALFTNQKLFTTTTLDLHGTDSIVQSIHENKAQVVLMESLQNFNELRLIDVKEILTRLAQDPPTDLRYIILDESALPGTFNPYSCFDLESSPFEVFLVASCSKYLQLGFDVNPAGILLGKPSSVTELNRIGKAGGYVAHETPLWVLPEVDRPLLLSRLQNLSQTCTLFAHTLKKSCSAPSALHITTPSLQSHPSHQIAENLPYTGGLITCVSEKCASLSPNIAAKRYHSAILEILSEAGALGIDIADSEGFGFLFPRIHLCKWPDEAPFLRFAFGELPLKQIEPLADICATAFRHERLL